MKGSLFEAEQSLYSCQGNTIKKAYLCHSKIRLISEGDIILFYRSKDRKSIQCMGIVENVQVSRNIEDVFPLIAKRTVYGIDELRYILNQPTLIILFRYVPLDKMISNEVLLKTGIKGNIQTIRQISNEQYLRLINEK